MNLGKHKQFNDFSDGRKKRKDLEKSGLGVKTKRIFMISHAFCRPKTMQNHDPPKPHKLKEASNDMLAELPIFASIFQYLFMFLPERLPDFILSHFFRNFTSKT